MPQIDTARTRARTSLGPGDGTGTSRISSRFGSSTTSAFIVVEDTAGTSGMTDLLALGPARAAGSAGDQRVGAVPAGVPSGAVSWGALPVSLSQSDAALRFWMWSIM